MVVGGGWWLGGVVVVVVVVIATSHFHGSSDSYVIYNKRLTFQTSLTLEVFAPDFSVWNFSFKLMNVKHES